VVTGGLGGAMEAASRGAKAAGGTTLGILPSADADDANEWVDVAVPTGLGEARNVLLVRAADALIAVAGEFGTLSEIALALKVGKPVVGLATWEPVGPCRASWLPPRRRRRRRVPSPSLPGAHHRQDREVVAGTCQGHHAVPHLVVAEPHR
jgi:hypothetical protein